MEKSGEYKNDSLASCWKCSKFLFSLLRDTERTKGKTESVSDRQCDVWADHHSSVFVKAPKAVERQELYECKFDF